MKYRMVFKQEVLRIYTILRLLKENDIDATELKLLNGEYQTVVVLGPYGSNSTLEKVKKLLEAL
ncbi:MAG: hypothetical protein GX452_13880 [Ignavibacteriales bacterium]|nr:hypothetical protein [Ignavibacteriales bacterium]